LHASIEYYFSLQNKNKTTKFLQYILTYQVVLFCFIYTIYY